MYSAPSGYPRFSAAIETCAIQSCNRFTASSCRFVISALISAWSFVAEMQCPASTSTVRKTKNFVLILKCECFLFRSRGCRRQSAKFLNKLVKLSHIIIDVFVAIRRIKIACQAGCLVGGDFLGRTLNIVRNLVARLVGAAAGQGELVSGGPIPR